MRVATNTATPKSEWVTSAPYLVIPTVIQLNVFYYHERARTVRIEFRKPFPIVRLADPSKGFISLRTLILAFVLLTAVLMVIVIERHTRLRRRQAALPDVKWMEDVREGATSV